MLSICLIFSPKIKIYKLINVLLIKKSCSSVFLTVLIFSPEFALIRDQVLINVGAYDPKALLFLIIILL